MTSRPTCSSLVCNLPATHHSARMDADYCFPHAAWADGNNPVKVAGTVLAPRPVPVEAEEDHPVLVLTADELLREHGIPA